MCGICYIINYLDSYICIRETIYTPLSMYLCALYCFRIAFCLKTINNANYYKLDLKPTFIRPDDFLSFALTLNYQVTILCNYP